MSLLVKFIGRDPITFCHFEDFEEAFARLENRQIDVTVDDSSEYVSIRVGNLITPTYGALTAYNCSFVVRSCVPTVKTTEYC